MPWVSRKRHLYIRRADQRCGHALGTQRPGPAASLRGLNLFGIADRVS